MIRKITPEEFINKFLKLLNQVNKTDIKKYLEFLKQSDHRKDEYSFYHPEDMKSAKRELRTIIGTLPFVLLSKQYFPTNENLNRFAKSMGININFWKKRSRPEMIGIIITEVSQYKLSQLSNFNMILNEVLGKVERYKKSNFFDEWNKAIKSIEFRR